MAVIVDRTADRETVVEGGGLPVVARAHCFWLAACRAILSFEFNLRRCPCQTAENFFS